MATKVRLRVNLDTTTVDVDISMAYAEARAESIVQSGVWDGNILYPPHRIVSIQIVEEK